MTDIDLNEKLKRIEKLKDNISRLSSHQSFGQAGETLASATQSRKLNGREIDNSEHGVNISKSALEQIRKNIESLTLKSNLQKHEIETLETKLVASNRHELDTKAALLEANSKLEDLTKSRSNELKAMTVNNLKEVEYFKDQTRKAELDLYRERLETKRYKDLSGQLQGQLNQTNEQLKASKIKIIELENTCAQLRRMIDLIGTGSMKNYLAHLL